MPKGFQVFRFYCGHSGPKVSGFQIFEVFESMLYNAEFQGITGPSV